MPNPVATLLSAAGTTQAAFAERYGFSKQAVVYLLAGTFTRIPPDMLAALHALGEEKSVDTSELEIHYWEWQIQERAGVGQKLYGAKLPFRFDDDGSPAHYFMVDTFGSRERFAKEMKVPPASLMRWENGLTKGMPAALESALRDVGYSHFAVLLATQMAWVQVYRGS